MFDCRVYNAISSEPSFVLILLHVISIPLTGKVTCQFCHFPMLDIALLVQKRLNERLENCRVC